jgi:hypothetical protein
MAEHVARAPACEHVEQAAVQREIEHARQQRLAAVIALVGVDAPRFAFLERAVDAETLADQRRISRDIQVQAWEDVPYIPTGAWMQPFAFRRNITDMLNGFPLFHNIRKA